MSVICYIHRQRIENPDGMKRANFIFFLHALSVSKFIVKIIVYMQQITDESFSDG
jgi:hypothetical protein